MARSALSSFVYNNKFGSEPLVARFMKGCFESRPKFKYVSLFPKWDPTKVIDFLCTWYPNDTLSLKELTLKCCFLLILITGQRVQTMANILVQNISFLDNECTIVITTLLKHSRQTYQQQPLQFQYFEDKSICVVQTLKDYLCRTQKIRQNNNKLFLSFVKPHKEVNSETISRWVKLILSMAGISTHVSAHSTRSVAASSAAAAGVPIDVILKSAGWSRETTFTRFYKKTAPKTFCSFLQGNSTIHTYLYSIV